MIEVILFQPEIPQNTGNIARTCLAAGARLKLIRPLGFSLSSRLLKRAGLDYLNKIEVQVEDRLEPCLVKPCYFFSTKGKRPYTQINFELNSKLIFGSESSGLPVEYHEKWNEDFYSIPMMPDARSLNLSNAVAIVLYEAWRQHHFKAEP